MAVVDSRTRLLTILKILFEESDEEHALLPKDILQKLKLYGIDVERKAVYKDLEALMKFGIEKVNSRYFYDDRVFQDIEFVILMEAIASLKAIPIEKSECMIQGLKRLMGNNKAKELAEGIFVDTTKRVGNKEIYYTLDKIRYAIKAKRKIRFQYGEKEKENCCSNGKVWKYVLSPYKILLVDQKYYLVGNFDKHDNLANCRIDRIHKIEILDKEEIKPLEETTYQKKELDSVQYVQKQVGMFSGEVKHIILKCKNTIKVIMREKFGESIRIREEKGQNFIAYMECATGEPLERWLMSYADQITVLEPLELKKTVIEKLKESISYQKDMQ